VRATSAWSERVRVFRDGRYPSTKWHFVADGEAEGAGYFVGYDSVHNNQIGYLGVSGFQENLPPKEDWIPFSGAVSCVGSRLIGTSNASPPTPDPGSGSLPPPSPDSGGQSISSPSTTPGCVSIWDVYILGRDDNLYHIDLQSRTVDVTLPRTHIDSGAFALIWQDQQPGTKYRPVVRTTDAVLVLDVRGREEARFPIPEAIRPCTFSFTLTTSGDAVMYTQSRRDELSDRVEYCIWRVPSKGEPQEARVVAPVVARGQAFRVSGGAILPGPGLVCYCIAVIRVQTLLDNRRADTLVEAFARACIDYWPSLAVAFVIATIFASLCYRRQVRYGASRFEQIVWTLFVFVFGLPGWIGYRFGRTWPVLEACHACDAIVPRDRETCVRCFEEFPLPALRGTEVFA
jgi:hypothetical protein